MTRTILTTLLLLCSTLSFEQTTETVVSKIKTISQAEIFIAGNPKAEAKIFEIKSGDDTNEIFLPLYNKKEGFLFHIDDIKYKILKVDSSLSFRVNYVFLNGEKISKKQADSIRQEIVTKYNAGTPFVDLVQQYNMDGSQTGDTNWFVENMMVKGFEEAVKNHKKNEVFTVDTPEQNWYHVVLKTFDDTFIKKITLLRTK